MKYSICPRTCRYLMYMVHLVLLMVLFSDAHAADNGVSYQVVTNEITCGVIHSNYLELTRWPTAVEMETGKVASSDFATALAKLEWWLNRVLAGLSYPTNLSSAAFGVRRQSPSESDMLYAEYPVGDVRVRIRDSAAMLIVTVTDHGLTLNSVTNDWGKWVWHASQKYLTSPGVITNFTKMSVMKYEPPNIFRITPVISANPTDRSVTWGMGNPVFWVEGSHVTFVIKKLLVGYPVDEEYGVRQRFPPLRTFLEGASLNQLVEHVSGDYMPMERSVAVELLVRRTNNISAIPLMMSAYTNANDQDVRIGLAHAMMLIGKEKRESSQTAAVRELFQREIAKEKNTMMKQILEVDLLELSHQER